MKAKNEIVIISGILALLVTTIIAASYSIQPVNAMSSRDSNFGNVASGQAQDSQNDQTGGHGLDANSNNHDPSFGGTVSCYAKNGGHCP